MSMGAWYGCEGFCLGVEDLRWVLGALGMCGGSGVGIEDFGEYGGHRICGNGFGWM